MNSDDESLLTDELDHEILKHRDAHFGGSFDVMLDYYEAEKIGANPDFDIERIEYLAGIEKETGHNLAALVLTASEAEEVAKSRKAYQDFKTIYENNKPQNYYPRLIADLILSEDEEGEQEIDACVQEGKEIVPYLIQILKSEEAYNPLFPGYGYAPFLAMKALGKIGDPKAIVPIFETLSRESLFDEDAGIAALNQIGTPAKEFLLKRIASRPLTKDNITAAFALTAFPPDEEIANACLKELGDPQVRQKSLFALYLLFSCECLKENREKLIQLSKEPHLNKDLKEEMERIIRSWEI